METLFWNSGKWRLGKPLVSFKSSVLEELTVDDARPIMNLEKPTLQIKIDMKALPYRRFWRMEQGNSAFEEEVKGR